MDKHTKGPWRFEEGTMTIRAVPENYWITTIAKMDSFDGAVNHKANARLIAAAPDMLEALKEAIKEVEAFEKRTGCPQFVPWIKKTREAIEKAEGRS